MQMATRRAGVVSSDDDVSGRGLRWCGIAMLPKLSRNPSLAASYYSVSTSSAVWITARKVVRYEAEVSQHKSGRNLFLVATSVSAHLQRYGVKVQLSSSTSEASGVQGAAGWVCDLLDTRRVAAPVQRVTIFKSKRRGRR
jgi:hypothetical protein